MDIVNRAVTLDGEELVDAFFGLLLAVFERGIGLLLLGVPRPKFPEPAEGWAGSGYIARCPGRTFGTPAPLLQRSLAPKNRRSKLPASLRPKGSLSLTLRGSPRSPSQHRARPNRPRPVKQKTPA